MDSISSATETRLRHRLWFFEGVTVFVPVIAMTVGFQAQQPKPIPLEPSNGHLVAEFSRIMAIRELFDGRVLIVDRKPAASVEALLIGDFESGTAKPVVGKGKGPREYDDVGPLFPIGRDSTLMLTGRRWFMFVGTTLTASSPETSDYGKSWKPWSLSSQVAGADRNGRILRVNSVPFAPPTSRANDSAVLVLVDRVTGRSDTVGHLPPPPPEPKFVDRPVGAKVVLDMANDFENRGHAYLFPDGWVAIVRMDPYRVEWRSPRGQVVRGPRLGPEPAPMTDADKRLYVEWQSMHWEMFQTYPLDQTTGWPTRMPLVPGFNPLVADRAGRIWIARVPTAARPMARFDVVDRSGRLVGWIERPVNERLVGFGEKSIYFVSVDEDNVQTLKRYPWP